MFPLTVVLLTTDNLIDKILLYPGDLLQREKRRFQCQCELVFLFLGVPDYYLSIQDFFSAHFRKGWGGGGVSCC